MSKRVLPEKFGRILIYQTEQGNTRIDVYFAEDTVWMSQKSMAQLYQTTPQNVTLHIKNILAEGELDTESTCKDYLQVQTEGTRQVKSVQNKLEFAATGHTAPEIIAARADATKGNMGLTNFKGAKVRRGDVIVAKNYTRPFLLLESSFTLLKLI